MCLNSLVIAKNIRNVCIETEESLNKYLSDFESPSSISKLLDQEEELILKDEEVEMDTLIEEELLLDEKPFILQENEDYKEEIFEELDFKEEPDDQEDIFKVSPWWGQYVEPEKPNIQPDTHPCSICGHILKRSQLSNHEKKHFQAPPTLKLECDLCGKLFSQKGNIIRHMLSIHVKQKRFICGFTGCGKGYYKKDMFQYHMKMHLGIKDVFCSICGKGFVSNGVLRVHQRVHSGERPYQCDYCQKNYAHHTDLKRHRVSHTKDYPYKCSFVGCTNGYIRKADFMAHEKTHLSGKYSRKVTRLVKREN